ncbi:ParB/RepB/Spo0J family partition protein [Streptomyces anulatus]|uniref:ParB/RepB/Spo0J family partition protein n=1 Tax=Streptomyces anulatus TaxID=1892 RepID=UPI00342508DD
MNEYDHRTRDLAAETQGGPMINTQEREHHPVAALFPMLSEDELEEMAADIKARGLLQDIVLDQQGRILDGRNRYEACARAEVEPRFTTYDGEDPDGYALSVNIARRHLTKGQQAMVAARAWLVSNHTARSAANHVGVSHARVVQASTVLQHAPDLADAVVAGAMGLDEAYRIARENKTKADSAESQLARLRTEDSELADKVVEGELTLVGAWAERKARAAEEERQRRVATHLLCEIVPALAQTEGTATFARYDPSEALPGRAITREVIARAAAALDEMARTWKERDLS